MRPLLYLVLALAGTALLYNSGNVLDIDSPFQTFIRDPRYAVVVGAVFLLALGGADVIRRWHPGQQRVAILGAATLAFVGVVSGVMKEGVGDAGKLEALWRAVALAAVPAAVLAVWAWVRGGARFPTGDGLWSALDKTGRSLAPYRIPVALALGVGVPTALFLSAKVTEATSADETVFPVALVVIVTAALYVFPAALISLSDLPLRTRWLLTGSVSGLWLVFLVLVGFGVGAGQNQSATILNNASLFWVTAMALPVLASFPFYVSLVVRWVRSGFNRPAGA